MTPVEQKLLTLPEHLSSRLLFSGDRVARSLVFCECFVDHCLSFSFFSFGHCVVCSSLIYLFWLPIWYLLDIVLSVPLWYTYSDYLFDNFWALCCLLFFDIFILITSLVSFGNCVLCSSLIYLFWLPLWYRLGIVLSVLLWYTYSDFLFGIFKLFLHINTCNIL